MFTIHPATIIKKTEKKGLGIFTREDLDINTLIEISPVILLSPSETKLIHETKLHDYYFSWGNDQKSSAIALGNISLYNHSTNPNCIYEANFESNTILIKTIRRCSENEELTINYNLDTDSDNKMWFEVKE